MNFKLKTFANKELKKYLVIRNTGYNIDNPQGNNEEFKYLMVIYKKTLKVISPNQDGIRVLNQLNGKIEKKYDLRLQDIIVVENLKYRVIELLPRLYADFNEFVLELLKDEE
ncbi:MAG: hypothetical protein SOY60_06940 [Fusobacterium gastrosuis]|uniref:hypothetical protein n=1 Tax=Fusobacterium gastrosuis TaxID=1755100 RepID=UPI002A84A68D|nr:hypothetical protein [Fusobacterium gastrosuis]